MPKGEIKCIHYCNYWDAEYSTNASWHVCLGCYTCYMGIQMDMHLVMIVLYHAHVFITPGGIFGTEGLTLYKSKLM